MAAARDEVILLDFSLSTFGMRVRIALAEKQVKYDYKEDNLSSKSDLLLQMNPVHKTVPVLVHNDPYERAQAKFWADYIDKKVYDAGKKINHSKGEEQEQANKDFFAILRTLEGQLGDKPYFGGNKFGFVDVALIPFYCWFYTLETVGNFKIEPECPKLIAWAKRCMEKETVANNIHDEKKIYEFICGIRKKLGLE
ncbi:hypothetical protein ACFE04_023641 [Oxalis oulophora]